MSLNIHSDNSGFTLLAALMLVMVMGIMLGVVGQSWQTVMQREKEEELLFRGMQYRQAFYDWYSTPRQPGQPRSQDRPGPGDLKDLLQDPHSLSKKRYIRRIYKDPLINDPKSGEPMDFELLRDSSGRINGIASSSKDKPFKIGNFTDELKMFEGRKKYSDWRFGFGIIMPVDDVIGQSYLNSK